MIINQSDNESSSNALKKISLISSNVTADTNNSGNHDPNNNTTSINFNTYIRKFHAKQKKNKYSLKPLKSVIFK